MHTGLGQARTAEPSLPIPIAASTKEIPYDYVTVLEVTGQFGNRVQGVINVSVDGAFVATAIGYSFLPPRLPKPGAVPLEAAVGLAKTSIVEVQKALTSAVTWATWQALLTTVLGDSGALEEALRCAAQRFTCFDFLYTIVDAAAGRELSNAPIHSMAGLGNEAGFRPFREFSKPMLFLPRSSIRVEIVEQSQGRLYTGGRLYFVLHGYKLLNYGMAA